MVYVKTVLLAFNIMRSFGPLGHHTPCEQVQRGDEETENEEVERLEPLQRSLQTNLQVEWNSFFKMGFIYEDERHGFPGHVRSDIGHGCSSGDRSSWKDHGIVYSSYISCNHCKPDAGSFQRWWKRKWITVWRWSQTSSST